MLALIFALTTFAGDDSRIPLRVLFVGNAQAKRSEEYRAFLAQEFQSVSVAERKEFDPAQAKDADVVLLDYHVADANNNWPPTKTPLGKRETWQKPTVLLGSAGMLVSIAWQTRGGLG